MKQRNTRKFTNMWKLNTLLINGSNKKSKEKLENTLTEIKVKTQYTKTYER